VNEQQKRSNIALAAEADRIARQPNGDPGGEDAFDGGCPSDTIKATATQYPCDAPGLFYALAIEHHFGGTPMGCPGLIPQPNRAAAEAMQAEWKLRHSDTRTFVIEYRIPAKPEIAK